MPHYFAWSGTPIELDESPDDVGVRFGHEDGPVMAKTAFRALVRTAPQAAAASALPARRFGRFMLLHDSGAGAAPVETVVNALPHRLTSRVARTMPVFVERESKLKLVATEQILVGFKPKSSASSRRKLLDGLGLTIAGGSEFDPARQIVVPTSVRRASRTLDLANQLVAADDIITYAAPNFLAEVRKGAVNDPQFKAQWHLDNTGQNGATAMQDVRALAAWERVGGGDPSIVIAIIDDGIDLDHPDLARNIWKNPKAGARDKHGRDFVDDSDKYNPRPKVFIPPFDDTDRNDIHGTPCAGVAAAVGNNGQGVAGMAWNCRLMAVKILAGPDLAPNDRITDAIRYASDHADVLSCSWGTARHPDIESAVQYAVTRGRDGRGSRVRRDRQRLPCAHRVPVEQRARRRRRRLQRSRGPLGVQQPRRGDRRRCAEQRRPPSGDYDDRRQPAGQGLQRRRVLRRFRRHVVRHAARRGRCGARAVREQVAEMGRGPRHPHVHGGQDRQGERRISEGLQREVRIRPRECRCGRIWGAAEEAPRWPGGKQEALVVEPRSRGPERLQTLSRRAPAVTRRTLVRRGDRSHLA